MKTPFLGGSYVARSRNLAYDRTVNLIPIMADKPQTKDVGMLIGTPGLTLLAVLGFGPIRGGKVGPDGYAYIVSGSGIFRVTNLFTAAQLGSMSTSSGPVSIIFNTTQACISDGSSPGYIVNLASGAVSSAGLPTGAQLLIYQDGFGITNINGTQQFFQSNLNDLSVWGVLNFSSADSQPDGIIGIGELHREIWLSGPQVTEIWINAGLPNFVFQRLTGVLPEHGCLAPYSMIHVGESLMWLGQDEHGAPSVVRTQGYNLVNVLDEATAYAFAQAQKNYGIQDAVAFAYMQERHLFYWLVLPSANQSWCYDVYTNKWHERASLTNSGAFTRHIATCGFFFANKTVVGDYSNGNIYSLDLDVYQDNGKPKKWLRSWRALPPNQTVYQPMEFNELCIDMQTGIDVPPADNPEVMLRWTDDGGHTFSNEKQASIGKTGETGKRIRFTRMGSTKRGKGLDRIFELSGAYNAPTAMIGADLDASVS